MKYSPLLDFVTLVPGGDNEYKCGEETSFEYTEEHTGSAELTPSRYEPHTKLSNAPTNNTDSEPCPCTQPLEDQVAG